MGCVILSGYIALDLGGWTINRESHMHAKAGFCIFVLGIAMMLCGVTTSIVTLKCKMHWNTKWVLRIANVHRYFGYGVVLVSQFIISTGFIEFYSFDSTEKLGWTIGSASGAIFFILLLFGELKHQYLLRREVLFVLP